MRDKKLLWFIFTIGILSILLKIAVFFESIALVVTAVPAAIGLGYIIVTRVENERGRFY